MSNTFITMPKYCVYLTTYLGNKLPMFYIGSSSVAKLENGYRGTVLSKKFKAVWKAELKENPHLFKTQIIVKTFSRKFALQKEKNLQMLVGIPRNPMYINRAVASPNGYFGQETKGIKLTAETKKKMSASQLGHFTSDETKEKIRSSLKGNVITASTRRKISKANSGVKKTEAHKQKIKMSLTGLTRTEESKQRYRESWVNREKIKCPHCKKEGSHSNMKRWHFENCKLKQIHNIV